MFSEVFPFYHYRRRARSGGCPKGDRERARRYCKVTRLCSLQRYKINRCPHRTTSVYVLGVGAL
ncbi:hypothetical protein NQZ68_034086 [Dissostichus eleginoides]|nr:hypothetical protein NQZ68_034086 [Dissostichus eleginoides]